MMFRNFIFVGLGGALGSIIRYAVTLLSNVLNISPNWATIAVNVIGSFLIGLFLGLFGQGTLMLFLTVGFCGGFTTFSTFSSQALTLLQNGHYFVGFSYIFGSLILCMLFAWLGTQVAGTNLA